nr:EOG090X0665 [Eulimnadia texana]
MYTDDYAEYDVDYVDEYDGPTGDPHLDAINERGYGSYSSGQAVPDVVKDFIIYFRDMVNAGSLYEIQNLYENTFSKLTEEHFKTTPWPDAEEIAPLVDDDQTFLILYKELYYRHIYAQIQGGPTVEQRFESYYNYCQLFNYILSASTPVSLELPHQWLWEIIDEFVYQFQSFSLFRSSLHKKSGEELEFIRANPNLWNIHSVLNVLYSLVEKSQINQQLEAYAKGEDPDVVAGEFGRRPLYKMLGYFSLVGLLRLHSLLGDFYQAIKVLENMELNKKTLYSRVPACQISTYYYVGFAYLMMRRYADAIRTFSHILLYVQRTKPLYQAKTYQNDQINKQTERMYVLLSICLVLHPQRIDESLQSILREKPHSERVMRMQKGELQEFENAFAFASPKFLSPVPPPVDSPPMDHRREPFQQLAKVFMDEVQQQLTLPTIRSYLRLYTTMPVAKMAAFLEMPEAEFRTHLLCFKHKMKNVVWTKGTSGLEGELQTGSEVDFYIDGGMIHIADTKVARRYGDYFIRQIHKLEEINRNLKSMKL